MTQQNWSPDICEIGDRIAALTVTEAAELGKYLETVHAIQAHRPPALVLVEDLDVTGPDQGRIEPTEFDVVLDGFDTARKVAVIRLVREAGGFGLKEAKDLVEAFPRVVKERLPRAEADKLKAVLEAAGAKVSFRVCTP